MVLTLVFTMTNMSVFAAEEPQQGPMDQTETQSKGDLPPAKGEGEQDPTPIAENLRYRVQAFGIGMPYDVEFTWTGKDVTSYIITVKVNGKITVDKKNVGLNTRYVVKKLKGGGKCSIEVTPVFSKEGAEDKSGTPIYREVKLTKPVVTGFEAHPDYKSVYLMWNPVAGKNIKYIVRRTGGNEAPKYYNNLGKLYKKNNKLAKRLSSGVDKKGLAIMYEWSVAAVSADGVTGDFTPIKKAKRVETMYIVGTIKSGGAAYYSKNKKGSRLGTLKGGTKIYTTSYLSGRYGFKHKGRTVWVNRLRLNPTHNIDSNPNTRGAKLRYKLEGLSKRSAQARYSKITKENYFMRRANGGPTKSATKYGIWISLHTQEVTVFINRGSRSNPNWKVYKEFWCASGKADTPTVHANGTIHKKRRVSKGGSLFYLSYFAGGNAMHTKRKSNVLGVKPLSHGCVRMEVNEVKWIYNNCPVGTKVFIK